MKIYLVGERYAEGDYIDSVYKTYEGAKKEWNKKRLKMLRERQSTLKRQKVGVGSKCIDSYIRLLEEIIKKLKEKDPAKIDCWPHCTPYIQEMELLE
jgi:hypothetical protein